MDMLSELKNEPTSENIIQAISNSLPLEKKISPTMKLDLKQSECSNSKPKTALQRTKDSIRKLPMFESYKFDSDYLDFEWPQKALIKTISDVK